MPPADIDFVLELIHDSPSLRPTAAQVLQSPFVLKSALTNKYAAGTQFRKLTVLGYCLTSVRVRLCRRLLLPSFPQRSLLVRLQSSPGISIRTATTHSRSLLIHSLRAPRARFRRRALERNAEMRLPPFVLYAPFKLNG